MDPASPARPKDQTYATYDLARVGGPNPTRVNAPVHCLGESTSGTHFYRSADVLLDSPKHRRVCVDVTVVSPLSVAKVDRATRAKPGYLAREAARTKVSENGPACHLSGKKAFLPFAADVCGLISEDAASLIDLAVLHHRTPPVATAIQSLPYRQRISFAIQLGVARQLNAVVNLVPPIVVIRRLSQVLLPSVSPPVATPKC